MPMKADSAARIEALIRDTLRDPALNTLQDPANERAWADPLVGFSCGDDPLYKQYKEYVGPFHWTPVEAFVAAFPDSEVAADELTVISWVLPQTEATREDNRRQETFPAERWARARVYGEQANDKLRQRIADALSAQGHQAVAPVLAPGWKSMRSDWYVFSSTWSERHAAYASGMGTFGLCDGLITPAGKAVRLGSVVARIQIPPTRRSYNDRHAYCLFFSGHKDSRTGGRICGRCMARCPVGAITEAGHDKDKCSEHTSRTTAKYVRSQYGFNGYGCGLCQTGVPCEFRIPTVHDV
jgi:epoxyqueuosine reductase